MEKLPSNNTKEGKTNAIISYLTIIGTIIALVLNNGDKKNSFASFHIRQNIGLNILYFFNQWIVYKYFGLIAFWIIGGITFVLWVIGFIGVLNEEKKLVPIFGDKFQEWFKSL